MPSRFFSIHGHFYQPPRIDPFTEEIPEEYGADPYGNWTEKIFHECYEPNAKKGNFEKISFNFGPNLFAWMDENHPETAKEIIQQEHIVYQRTGLSNAMAHPYFHIILPLANERDKKTMVRWGIRDYEVRFGRKPLGMWLPETAVNLPTLQVFAEHGIEFVILAPWQADADNLDTTRTYKIKLEGNKEISALFFNNFLSKEMSFNPSATENADKFVEKWLLPHLQDTCGKNICLSLAAMDGELFGHHHKFRDAFLSYLLDGAVESAEIENTFPALWIKENPPQDFIKVKENTSWSCMHGIQRWMDVCGDAPSATWKKPLREFMNFLSESIDTIYESSLDDLIPDVWKLRDEYVDALLNQKKAEEIIRENAFDDLDEMEISQIETLLSAQFERLRMFSSDAWFFYDIDRIEPINALKYAAHASSLVELATGIDPSDDLTEILIKAKSEVSSVTGEMAFLGFLKKFEKVIGENWP